MSANKRALETAVEMPGNRGKKLLPRLQNLGTSARAIGNLHRTPAGKLKTRSKIGNVLPKSLSRQIARVHRLAREAGLFMEDRDLLHCVNCGLLEDVGYCGLLMTYLSGKPPVDSGLRFTKDNRERYVCPKCGGVVRTEKPGKTT